jgi:hypothetical protein
MTVRIAKETRKRKKEGNVISKPLTLATVVGDQESRK